MLGCPIRPSIFLANLSARIQKYLLTNTKTCDTLIAVKVRNDSRSTEKEKIWQIKYRKSWLCLRAQE